MMQTDAVVFAAPGDVAVRSLGLVDPSHDDAVIDIAFTGISTGTERLLWSGQMPPFPGMGYPLVPGYEAVGEVVEAPRGSGLRAGSFVFVPGATCYRDASGLFGGAAARIVTRADRTTPIDADLGARGVLLALAATARHAMATPHAVAPDLIIGHGTLGRLLARIAIATGAPAPTVHEVNPGRMSGGLGYEVVHPDADDRRDYRAIYDASGDAGLVPALIGRLVRGGEVVLAGFYSTPISFAFPPAFMREARLRIAAEWTPGDMVATRALVDSGALSLDGLITHDAPAGDAAAAYATAFTDPACLKMILNWKDQS